MCLFILVMSCPLVLLLSLGFVLASVSADPRSFLDVTQSEVYQQLASLPRENLLRIIIHFLEDEDLEKIGIKNMGELQVSKLFLSAKNLDI